MGLLKGQFYVWVQSPGDVRAGRRDTDGETWAAEAQRKERSPFLSWEREVFLKKSFTPRPLPPTLATTNVFPVSVSSVFKNSNLSSVCLSICALLHGLVGLRSRPGVESQATAVKALGPNHWVTWELPCFILDSTYK